MRFSFFLTKTLPSKMISGPYVFQWFLEACLATALCAAKAHDFQKTLKNNYTRDHFARTVFNKKYEKRVRAKSVPGAFEDNDFCWCGQRAYELKCYRGGAARLSLRS